MLHQLQAFFQERGVPCYLVGGYLRDLLLRRPTHDLDLAVSGSALALARDLADTLGGSYVPLDAERDIARVVAKEAAGASWSVDLASFSGDIASDLARRDFSINALALPLELASAADVASGVIDPSGGLKDLARHIVRAVTDATFTDDPIRLLRAPRLAHQLQFALAPLTQALIRRDAPLLSGEPGERLRDELLRLLEPPGVLDSLTLLDDMSLLTCLFPELELGRGLQQPPEHHWDVLHHNLQCAAAVEEVLRQRNPGPGHEEVISLVPWDGRLAEYFAVELSDGSSRGTWMKLAGLLHDVAKPHTRQIDPSGRMRFIGHHKAGAHLVQAIGQRLRLSRRGTHFLSTLVEHHLRPTQMSAPGELPTPRAVFRFFRDAGDATVAVVFLNLADYLATRGPHLDLDDWRSHMAVVRHILAEGQNEVERGVPRLVNGHDLMRAFALAPGPQVGWLLTAVQEAQAAGEVTTSEEALNLARRLLPGRALDP